MQVLFLCVAFPSGTVSGRVWCRFPAQNVALEDSGRIGWLIPAQNRISSFFCSLAQNI